MQPRTRRRRGEEGQAIIMMALSLAAMLGVLALSIDIGRGYTMRRQQQNVADLSAMAGASIVVNYGSGGQDSWVANAVATVAAGNGVATVTAQYIDSNGTPVAAVG